MCHTINVRVRKMRIKNDSNISIVTREYLEHVHVTLSEAIVLVQFTIDYYLFKIICRPI